MTDETPQANRYASSAAWRAVDDYFAAALVPEDAALAAALRLTRPGAVIVIDNVVRDGAVVDADNEDARVQGVRRVVADIAENPDLDATAVQTVGIKGWDGLIIARRR